MVKITDYERIATVPCTQLGQIECPKCKGICDQKYINHKREWNCKKCGRGWNEVPEWVKTVEEAHNAAELLVYREY